MRVIQESGRKLMLGLLTAGVVSFFSGCGGAAGGGGPKFSDVGAAIADPIVGEEVAVLTAPPAVPPPITRKNATKVIVKMEVVEKVMKINAATNSEYNFWTYGGTVPGKFIRVREGDLVEFHLMNHPDNKNSHNIDLHAATGPGGGAASSLAAPGHTAKFSFKAINPGLYIYHCAAAPVPMHISNGMYGLILVEPKDGLPKVDKEYYVCQGDFYTKGKFGDPGLQEYDFDKGLIEQPTYICFNGSVAANAGPNALPAKVGDNVRLYVGNGGPNLTSAFHVIGEVFDRVYIDGGLTAVNSNVQTTPVCPGGSTIVDFKCEVQGMLTIVDHALYRVFNKGCIAQIKVEGEENKALYSGKISDEAYTPQGTKSVEDMNRAETNTNLSQAERMTKGKEIYQANCAACHLGEGQGMAGAFPPLAASDYLADKNKAITAVLNGLTDEITVNGKKYKGVMPPQRLSDNQVASVLTYVYNSWGNKGGTFTAEEVSALRKK